MPGFAPVPGILHAFLEDEGGAQAALADAGGPLEPEPFGGPVIEGDIRGGDEGGGRGPTGGHVDGDAVKHLEEAGFMEAAEGVIIGGPDGGVPHLLPGARTDEVAHELVVMVGDELADAGGEQVHVVDGTSHDWRSRRSDGRGLKGGESGSGLGTQQDHEPR